MESIILIALLLPGIVFLFAVVGALLFHPPQLRKEKNRGLCDRCGYNLTANVSGKCPECGLRINVRR